MDKFITYFKKHPDETNRIEVINTRYIIKFDIENRSYPHINTNTYYNNIYIEFHLHSCQNFWIQEEGDFDIKKMYDKITSFISSKTMCFLDLDKVLKESKKIMKKEESSRETQNSQKKRHTIPSGTEYMFP